VDAHDGPDARDPVKSLLVRAEGVLRRQGLQSFLGRALRRALGPVVRIDRLIFFVTDVTTVLPRLEARVPVDIRPATPEDFEAFAATFERMGVDPSELQERRDRGDVAFLALVGGRLVHSQWITFRAPLVSEIGVHLALGPRETCGYGAATLPEWRGHAIHPAVSLAVREYERAHGYLRHFAWAWARNFEAVRTTEKVGRPSRTVWSVWVLGMPRPVALGVARSGSPRLAPAPGPDQEA